MISYLFWDRCGKVWSGIGNRTAVWMLYHSLNVHGQMFSIWKQCRGNAHMCASACMFVNVLVSIMSSTCTAEYPLKLQTMRPTHTYKSKRLNNNTKWFGRMLNANRHITQSCSTANWLKLVVQSVWSWEKITTYRHSSFKFISSHLSTNPAVKADVALPAVFRVVVPAVFSCSTSSIYSCCTSSI